MDYPEEKIVGILKRNNIIALCFLLVLLASCKKKERLPYYDQADFTPLWDIDTLKHPIHKIANFSFTDQEANRVSNDTFKGKIYVANFFFTSCSSICPQMTKNLKVVANQFKTNRDVLFISYSVSPATDSVKRLKQFANRYHIKSSQWHLVTGDKAQINTLARRSYFAEEEPGLSKDSTEFLHTENCILVDREQRIRGVYNGTLMLEIERMKEDIKVLLQE